MSEKPVVIYVSRDFRNKVKRLKRELTYEVFFDDLLEKGKNPVLLTKLDPKVPKLPSKGVSL